MKAWRWLLFPLGVLYWGITFVRNFLFSSGLAKRQVIPGKSIVIGNLNVGGSGKSPMTLYLMKAFQSTHTIQLVSRGYGRKSKGHIQVNAQHTADQVGDEPLMYFQHKSERDEVHVAASRWEAIQGLSRQEKDLLLLDDAFQHLQIQAGFSILVSDFNAPFFKDYILPVGMLREPRHGANRANLMVYTKCPETIDEATKQNYIAQAQRYDLPAFFSRISYAPLKSIKNETLVETSEAILVTGIANPRPLKTHLEKTYALTCFEFADHHEFTQADINKIHQKFDTFDAVKPIIITTEKDFMRLKAQPLFEAIKDYPWCIQPIELMIENEAEFLTIIKSYVNKN